MARSKHLGYAEKRKVLFSKTMSADEIDAVGQELLDENRMNEALDFFEKSGNKEQVRIVAEKAREIADASTWMRAYKMLGETVTPEMWEGMAEHALDLGKIHFAIWAFEQAGQKERAESIRTEWRQQTMKREKEKA